MAILINIIHTLVCLALIIIVLFQPDKSEGLAGAFGGGASATIFGERGSGGFMSKFTTCLAVIFMISSLYLSVYAPKHKASVVHYTQQQTVPVPIQTPVSADAGSENAAASNESAQAESTAAPAESSAAPAESSAAPAESSAAPAETAQTAVAPIAPNTTAPAPAPTEVQVTPQPEAK